jgi:hypothetical protein
LGGIALEGEVKMKHNCIFLIASVAASLLTLTVLMSAIEHPAIAKMPPQLEGWWNLTSTDALTETVHLPVVFRNYDPNFPHVIWTSVSDGMMGVTESITITFDKPMDQDSLYYNLEIRDAQGQWLAGNVGGQDAIAVITFSFSLEYSSPYTLTVPTTVQDLLGNHLQAPYVKTFTTEPDAIPPGVTHSGLLTTTYPITTTAQFTTTIPHDNNQISGLWVFRSVEPITTTQHLLDALSLGSVRVYTSSPFTTMGLTVGFAEEMDWGETAYFAVLASDEYPSITQAQAADGDDFLNSLSPLQYYHRAEAPTNAEAYVNKWLMLDVRVTLTHTDVVTSELGSLVNGDPARGIQTRGYQLAEELSYSAAWEHTQENTDAIYQALLIGTDGVGTDDFIYMLWDNDGIGNPGVIFHKKNGTYLSFPDMPPDAVQRIKEQIIIPHLYDYCAAHPEEYSDLDLDHQPHW